MLFEKLYIYKIYKFIIAEKYLEWTMEKYEVLEL